MDAYQRNIVPQAPVKIETIALIGGSIALVAVVIIMKNRRRKKK